MYVRCAQPTVPTYVSYTYVQEWCIAVVEVPVAVTVIVMHYSLTDLNVFIKEKFTEGVTLT